MAALDDMMQLLSKLFQGDGGGVVPQDQRATPAAAPTTDPRTPDGAPSLTQSSGGMPATPPVDPTGATNAGMAPYTGFASRYQPGMLANQIYENPWYILPDVFNGISTSSPGYQALRDFGGDPVSLFNIMAGSDQMLGTQGTGGEGDFANFMAQLYQSLGTAGGQGFNSKELLGNIFGQDKFGADSQTTLGQILGVGGMSQQVRTLFNFLRDVANVSMNPLAAAGYTGAAAQAGDRYGNAMLNAPDAAQTPNIVTWMNQNMPWLTVQ
jgi:hypothetical protein